ncbi:hypothetical protein CERSUDRAFT_141018 [Gelatoporia subvermispora B]|uniref:PhoD-like phosphatase metallophosphatase domain-containing protein n=1 Tax=Ceriporiopsis subvermispora (strain B) TaxID=914234 RepID=M2QQQ0_CERS8|nr:hypothetical protein CERSUDRAFT_141018 [Gelatoporia subvermispora B]
MMAYTSAIVSTLFRACVFVFLEVIPIRFGKTVIPVLYFLYLLAVYFQQIPSTGHWKIKVQGPPTDGKSGEKKAGKQSTVVAVEPEVSLRNALYTLLYSTPSPIRKLRIANVVINTLLLAATVDFVVEPYFDDAKDVIYSRVGAVYPDAAKLVVRYPAENVTTNTVHIAWRPVDPLFGDDTVWRAGPVVELTQEDDWVGTVKLRGLWPSTDYEYRLQYSNGTTLPYPTAPIRFHTFPDPRLLSGSHFRFLASSCMTPNFPYMPFQGRRIKGFDLLADYLWHDKSSSLVVPSSDSEDGAQIFEQVSSAASELAETVSSLARSSVLDPLETAASSLTASAAPAPVNSTKPPAEFMIFMGDFIYADVPIYYGDDKEAYRRLYRRNYQSPSFRKVYERLPIIHTYDDHEIANNFAGKADDSTPPFPNASDAFRLYNAYANYDPPEDGQHYFDFHHGDAAFFVMDTRRYRSDVFTEDVTTRTMLGDKQLATLYDWLSKVNNTATFKFLVSSVPFTSLWQHDAQTDSWAGFPVEKAALLNALHSVPNVVILSGDRHEFAAIQYNAADAGHNVLELSTSPLSMFYIPLFRTLKSRSDEIVQRTKEVVTIGVDGVNRTTTVVEEVPQEEVVKYIATGNYKWSSIEVDTRDLDHPALHVETIIDGKEAFKLTVAGKPVDIKGTKAIISSVPASILDALGKIGLKPGRWF